MTFDADEGVATGESMARAGTLIYNAINPAHPLPLSGNSVLQDTARNLGKGQPLSSAWSNAARENAGIEEERQDNGPGKSESGIPGGVGPAKSGSSKRCDQSRGASACICEQQGYQRGTAEFQSCIVRLAVSDGDAAAEQAAEIAASSDQKSYANARLNIEAIVDATNLASSAAGSAYSDVENQLVSQALSTSSSASVSRVSPMPGTISKPSAGSSPETWQAVVKWQDCVQNANAHAQGPTNDAYFLSRCGSSPH